MQINVKSNISAFAKAMDAFGRDQIPFATAMALNDTARNVRDRIINDTWPSGITQRNDRFMKAALTPISKRNSEVWATKRNLRAIVGTTRTKMRRDYLQRLTEGGTKTPRGRHLAIPSKDNNVTRLGGGAIKKADRPRQLLNRKNVFIQKLVRSGDMAILRRVGKERYPLQMLYILEPSGQIKKQFDFYEDANSTARRAFDKNFAQGFAKAKKSMRRR